MKLLLLNLKCKGKLTVVIFLVRQNINNDSILRFLFTAAIRTPMQTSKIAAELKKLDRALLRLLFIVLLLL